MAAPVTGPFTSLVNRQANVFQYTNVRVGRRERVSRRQVKPYNLDLAFSYSDRQILSWTRVNPTPGLSAPYAHQDYNHSPLPVASDSLNRALSDFREKISSGASWGVTLAERKQAMGMMTQRLLQLTSFARDMRRFRFGDALRTLGITTDRIRPHTWRRLKRQSGALGNNILEVRFGWQPLWQDIHSTAELLCSDIPTGRIVGKGTARLVSTYAADDPYDYYGYVRRTRSDNHRIHTKVWADVAMVNPNAALLSNLGLDNPFLVAYELIPWSFVLNYFVSLDEFLRNFNPYAGYSLENKGYTVFQVSKRSDIQRETKFGSLTGNYATFTSQSVYVTRTVGSLPNYQLRVRDPWDLKPGRAINAIGLLLQQLGRR